MSRGHLTHEDYRVGWICPLEVEQVAALEMLDEEHEPLSQSSVDTNVYNLGSINNHNIVIAGLLNPGNCPAATVAVHMTRTFPCLHGTPHPRRRHIPGWGPRVQQPSPHCH